MWVLQSHLWASWVQNQTTDIAHIAAAPQAPSDNYYCVSLLISSGAAKLARAAASQGMRADVLAFWQMSALPDGKCHLRWVKTNEQPDRALRNGRGTTPQWPLSMTDTIQQPPLSWQTPATAYDKNIISALLLVRKLGKAKRAKELHEKQKKPKKIGEKKWRRVGKKCTSLEDGGERYV